MNKARVFKSLRDGWWHVVFLHADAGGWSVDSWGSFPSWREAMHQADRMVTR